MRNLSLAGSLVLLIHISAFAQISNQPVKILDVEPKAFYQDSVQTIQSNTKRVSVMGLKDAQVNDVPGTIYIIDQAEIQLSGARDIMEILEKVPGISFGTDVDGVIGISMHGIWAHEGKYVIQMNGLTLNETDFGTYAFSQRLFLGNVSRIEILYSPGTVLFGGAAALGVINIVTYAPGEKDGALIGLQTSASSTGIDRVNASITGNHYLGNQTSISYSANYDEGSKSSVIEESDDGKLINYRDSTQIKNSEIFLKLKRKNFQIQYYNNVYNFDHINEEYQVLMTQNQFELEYLKQLGSKNEIKFKSSFSQYTPWFYQNTTNPDRLMANTHAKKMTSSATLHSSITRKLTFFGGFSGQKNTTIHEWNLNLPDSLQTTYLSQMLGAAVFGDLHYKSKFGSFGISARAEINSFVDPEFAPRYYYTFKRENIYLKAVYSYGYKIPTIENINSGPKDTQLKSEHIRNTDVCIGLQSKKGDMIQISAFRNHLQNPIIYVFDDETLDNYINKGSIYARGIEFTSMIKRKDEFFRLNYSYSENCNRKGALSEIELPSSKSFQAIPRHKATALVGLKFLPWLRWSMSLVYQSRSSSYESDVTSESGLRLKTYDQCLLANIFLHFEPEKTSWSFRTGITNLLNSNYVISSPYNNGVASIPMNQAQLQLDLQYRITK